MPPAGEPRLRPWRDLAIRALAENPMVFFTRQHQASLSDSNVDLGFADLGMDSLGRMELSIWLERECGLDAADAQLQEFASLNELALFLAQRLGDGLRG